MLGLNSASGPWERVQTPKKNTTARPTAVNWRVSRPWFRLYKRAEPISASRDWSSFFLAISVQILKACARMVIPFRLGGDRQKKQRARQHKQATSRPGKQGRRDLN